MITEQPTRYQRTGLIEDMTDGELGRAYRFERGSIARSRAADIVAGVTRGNRRRAAGELARLDRRLAIMRRVADERGLNVETVAR